MAFWQPIERAVRIKNAIYWGIKHEGRSYNKGQSKSTKKTPDIRAAIAFHKALSNLACCKAARPSDI
jgi:hypothetical protein